ncbi:cytochrome P450 [Amycolatopsis sp. NPDC059657]|uniref:cytochrome P450 n=1 Tax=Amycolatopsis sp. NPDC059657 TaxID=3346899 RepID=UPI003671319D
MTKSVVTAGSEPQDPVRALHDWGAHQRATEPVIFDPGSGAWHVFSYEGANRVLTDRLAYSSEFPSEISVNDDLIDGNFALLDPPRHNRLRGVVSNRFTASAIGALRTEVDRVASTLLDELSGTEGVDFVDEFAYRLPATVIASVLGLPVADVPLFKQWSFAQRRGKRTRSVEHDAPDDITGTVLSPMREYLLDQLAQRRAAPKDDLITELAEASVDGVPLSDDEIAGFLRLLLTGGDLTTCSLLTSAVLCFDEHPGLLGRLRPDTAKIESAVEEIARCRPPFARAARWSTVDTELDGVRIPAGQMVIPWIISANRDERRFVDPDRFDVTREPNPHLSFGRGVHFCLGVHLAKLEATRAIVHLASRFHEISVRRDAPLRHFDPAGGVLALEELTVDFTVRR